MLIGLEMASDRTPQAHAEEYRSNGHMKTVEAGRHIKCRRINSIAEPKRGGGVFVPIYILILSFSTKNAAALSQATIFGGSMVNLAMNWRAKHPKRKHRPITDFATLLVFEPMLLVGTVIGMAYVICPILIDLCKDSLIH